jgi:rhodanese-related sulfurtransferase
MATLIDRDEVQRLVAHGARLVEVLPAEEYAEDHLPGAVSYPLRRIVPGITGLDKNRPIIVYCWDSA